MPEEQVTYLQELKNIIVGLVELDQECAVLDQIYREGSMKKIVARADETIGSLMLFKERVKNAKVEQYDKAKFKELIKKKPE